MSGGAYRVLIHDFVLPARIGVWKREKNVEQRVRVNVELTAARSLPLADKGARTGRRDRILRYDTVIAGVRRLVAEGHIDLCETMAERIAAMCLENRKVQAVKVRVEKLDVYADAASVGAEIERRRA